MKGQESNKDRYMVILVSFWSKSEFFPRTHKVGLFYRAYPTWSVLYQISLLGCYCMCIPKENLQYSFVRALDFPFEYVLNRHGEFTYNEVLSFINNLNLM